MGGAKKDGLGWEVGVKEIRQALCHMSVSRHKKRVAYTHYAAAHCLPSQTFPSVSRAAAALGLLLALKCARLAPFRRRTWK